MRCYKVQTYKANTQLKFESVEVGIWLEELNKKRMLGKVLGKALEYIYYSDNRSSILGDSSVIADGVSDKYNKTYEEQLKGLEAKVAEIHNMCLDLKTMALVGNRLELDSRAENLEISTYVLNRQINKLSKVLGITVDEFKSEKDNVKDVCDIVDLVIDSYGNMLSTLKVDNVVRLDSLNVLDLEEQSKGGVSTITEKDNGINEDGLIDGSIQEIDSSDFGLISNFL